MTPLPAPVGERAMQQLVTLYVTPEVERRRADGAMANGTPIPAAQVVFFPDGRRPIVRLNTEVRAILSPTPRDGVTKQNGDEVFADELGAIERISLPDDEPNCAHATILLLGTRWVCGFDSRYDREHARKHLDLGDQFLALARIAREKGWLGPFVANLFSAAELAAKATLLLMPDPEFRKQASHKHIATKFQSFAELGNVNSEFRDTLDRIRGWRHGARCLGNKKHDAASAGKQMLEIVSRMLADARGRLA